MSPILEPKNMETQQSEKSLTKNKKVNVKKLILTVISYIFIFSDFNYNELVSHKDTKPLV